MANELDDRAHKHTHTLAARGLKKNYGSRQVVKGVDLSVKSGEVVGLLGPNGAGKTTTFYMVVGLVVADGGDIELDGRSIARLPIYKRARLGVSYLPQEASVFRKLSVEDNIRAILEMQVDENGRALDTSEIEHRLEMLLDELQIKHLRTNAALSLSGGERRRTEIARALAANPRFILLDEPFAGVDPIAVIEIQRIVRFLRDRNIGVLITDHNVRETLAICDHAYIINEGLVLGFERCDLLDFERCAGVALDAADALAAAQIAGEALAQQVEAYDLVVDFDHGLRPRVSAMMRS